MPCPHAYYGTTALSKMSSAMFFSRGHITRPGWRGVGVICRTPPQTADHTPLSGPACIKPVFYVRTLGSGEYTFSGFKAAHVCVPSVFYFQIRIKPITRIKSYSCQRNAMVSTYID